MKNKSKLKKIQQRKPGTASMPKEWFYLSDKELTVREIYEVFKDNEGYTAEVWEEVGVAEIGIPEERSIDFETARVEGFDDEICQERIQHKEVKAAFFVTVGMEDAEHVTQILQQIVNALGGVFCADNEAMEPYII